SRTNPFMLNSQKRQAGGTLLGLIVGLILGLSIAVVAAVMIKNTPLPFTNKMSRPDKASDPATAGQIVDPNRSLQGNRMQINEAARNVAAPPNTVLPTEPARDAAEAARAAIREPA